MVYFLFENVMRIIENLLLLEITSEPNQCVRSLVSETVALLRFESFCDRESLFANRRRRLNGQESISDTFQTRRQLIQCSEHFEILVEIELRAWLDVCLRFHALTYPLGEIQRDHLHTFILFLL